MIRFAVLTAACLLFLPGCTDNLTSPEVKQEATTTGTNPDSKNLAKNENLAKNVRPVEYETGTTAVGNDVYVDRDYTITEVPSSFQDWTYVRTANDDKSAVTFTLTDTATVALAYDQRGDPIPSWLEENWTDTGKVLETTDVSFTIFTRVFGPSEVALGEIRAEVLATSRPTTCQDVEWRSVWVQCRKIFRSVSFRQAEPAPVSDLALERRRPSLAAVRRVGKAGKSTHRTGHFTPPASGDRL